MEFRKVHALIKDIPFIVDRNAEKLYNFIIEKK